MSHHIYHTRGIILGSVPIGESNRFYKILTEDLGLVSASAQSVREGKSKLRYALQDYSLISLDLVRGKEVWRVISAAELLGVPKSSAALVSFAHICRLTLRLVHGEGGEDDLFRDIVSMRNFLEKEGLSGDDMQVLETLTALRAVATLGYLDPTQYEEFLQYRELTPAILETFGSMRERAIVEINKAINASHL